MSGLKHFSISLITLLLFSGIALAAPAARAQTSSNDSTTTANSLADQFKLDAHQKLQTARQNAQVKTAAARQKACVARKAALTIRMNNAVRQAKHHKEVFDNIYTKVKNFYTTKQLNVADYSTLTANVDKAQADAQTQIDALSALNVSVDCTSQTVADSVDAFGQAVKTTHDSLKVYRASLTELINSLKGASTGSSANSTNQ
jgi:hypothetical protein